MATARRRSAKAEPVRRVALTECGEVVLLNDWYAGIAALRGLEEVAFVDGPAPPAWWLSTFLSDTRVIRP